MSANSANNHTKNTTQFQWNWVFGVDQELDVIVKHNPSLLMDAFLSSGYENFKNCIMKFYGNIKYGPVCVCVICNMCLYMCYLQSGMNL